MDEIQEAKSIVRAYNKELFNSPPDSTKQVLDRFAGPRYHWRGPHPFHELDSTEKVACEFLVPLRNSITSMQRREDVFMAGLNNVGESGPVWVCSMGHLAGLFDTHWLGIPATGKLVFLRFAEFFEVVDGKITQSAIFIDIINLMVQAGCYPLPPQTGASIIHPGPETHDGVQLTEQDPSESERTLALINQMIEDLDSLNKSGNDNCPPELMANTWHDDMSWYGPAGIGSTYTIERYQQQHQFPFRRGLKDKVFNGHVCRIAEGSYGGFFGWPNLTNKPAGGFLGLPSSDQTADMRVVDIYRREGDKLKENWVFIDLLHYLNMLGLDVLKRISETTAVG